MKNKRERKRETIRRFILGKEDTVRVGGDKNSNRVLITWGENWWVCDEVGKELGFKVVKPNYLEPFPAERLISEIENAESLTVVELSPSGQFEKLLNTYGIRPNNRFRKYDTRPIFKEDLVQFLEGLR